MILHDISDPADRIVRDRLPISFGRFRRVRYLELKKKKKKKNSNNDKGKRVSKFSTRSKRRFMRRYTYISSYIAKSRGKA